MSDAVHRCFLPGDALVLLFEAVAHAGFGDEVAGARRFGFEFLAELGEVDAEVVGLGAVVRAPYFGEESALGDEGAAVSYEDLQDGPFGGGQPQFVAVSADFFRGEVDGEGRGLYEGLFGMCGVGVARVGA